MDRIRAILRTQLGEEVWVIMSKFLWGLVGEARRVMSFVGGTRGGQRKEGRKGSEPHVHHGLPVKRVGLVEMGDLLGNPVIDRHRTPIWSLESFGTAVIEVVEIENHALCRCLSYPGLHPCATSALVYRGYLAAICLEQSYVKTKH